VAALLRSRVTRRLVVALAVLALCSACTGSSAQKRQTPQQLDSPIVSTVTPAARTSSPTPSASSAVELPRGFRLVHRTHSLPGQLIAGDGALFFAVQANGAHAPGKVRLVRYDPRTGAVRRSLPFRGGAYLAFAGGCLWTTEARGTPPSSVRSGTGVVLRFDPRTLTLKSSILLPAPTGPLARSAAGLWVGAGGRLYLVDADNGRILQTVTVRGRVGQITVDPSGDRLYVATYRRGEVQGNLSERDARSGELLAVAPRSALGGYPANDFAPTDRGVWVGAPTGNFGGEFFFREGTLRGGRELIEGYQSISASLAGGRLWILDDVVRVGYRCADPRSGRIEGSVHLPKHSSVYGLGEVVRLGDLFFTTSSKGIIEIAPTTCSS
jgi:hypothetical protein